MLELSPIIDRITLHHISLPLVTPFRTAFGTLTERECLLVCVRADGLVGWGECVAGMVPPREAVAAGNSWLYSYETTTTAWHALADLLIPRLLGAPADVARVVVAGQTLRGHPMAVAALEAAVWDVVAQAAGQSLATALGGQRSRVDVGVVVGLQRDSAALVDTLAAQVAAGYRRVKIKIGPGHDRALVAAARERFPDLPLWVDANSAYDLADADTLAALDEFDLGLIEQPLAPDNLVDHAELQRRLATPICLDESIASLADARSALALSAARVINIKPGRVGGLSAARRIHDLCHAAGIPVWCGGMLETGIGRAANLALAALSGFTLPGDLSASSRYYTEDLVEPPFTLNADGTMDVPTGAGLGVVVDEARVDAATLRRVAFR
jgi:O-succinylbenzoate synthase